MAMEIVNELQRLERGDPPSDEVQIVASALNEPLKECLELAWDVLDPQDHKDVTASAYLAGWKTASETLLSFWFAKVGRLAMTLAGEKAGPARIDHLVKIGNEEISTSAGGDLDERRYLIRYEVPSEEAEIAIATTDRGMDHVFGEPRISAELISDDGDLQQRYKVQFRHDHISKIMRRTYFDDPENQLPSIIKNETIDLGSRCTHLELTGN